MAAQKFTGLFFLGLSLLVFIFMMQFGFSTIAKEKSSFVTSESHLEKLIDEKVALLLSNSNNKERNEEVQSQKIRSDDSLSTGIPKEEKETKRLEIAPVRDEKETQCLAAINRFISRAVSIENLAQSTNDCHFCVDNPIHHRACLSYAWLDWNELFINEKQEEVAVQVFSDPGRPVKDRTWISGAYSKWQISYGNSIIEKVNWAILEEEAFKYCGKKTSPGLDPLVVIVGANDGYYAFGSSGAGCRVILFEPQGGCVPNLLFNALRNKHDHMADVRVAAASAEKIKFVTKNSCDGGAQYMKEGELSSNPSLSIPELIKSDIEIAVEVGSLRLDEVVNEDIQVLLIDTEGAEVIVLESSVNLFKNHVIHHAVIEWTTGRWEKFGMTVKQGAERAAVVAKLANWECSHLNAGVVDTKGRDLAWVSCTKPLIEFFEVYDGWDIYCRRKKQSWKEQCNES